ncbi:MAG: hypothetical protein U9N45_02085 [Gemmatimonadota bacterium]|nr:hypothetical protein [Gemmatimonadota bacterium]
MLAGDIRIIDIDPVGYANFAVVFPRLDRSSPQLVLWHEEGIPRRMLLGQDTQPLSSLSSVKDARRTARLLYELHRHEVRRVVVTDAEGYDRLYAAQNLHPQPNEEKYQYLERMIRVVIGTFDERVAIYPEPNLDRGPVSYERIRSFLTKGLTPESMLIFAVFSHREGELFFSFVAGIGGSRKVDIVTSFDHWEDFSLAGVEFSEESLEQTVDKVERAYSRPVACALFLERRDFDRLYDGRPHQELPGSLIRTGRAFGISSLPEEKKEQAFLDTAGLFAYVPKRIP